MEENIKHFLRVMCKHGIYLKRLSDREDDYATYQIQDIDRYVSFYGDRCKIGRHRFDGTMSWREMSIYEIDREIIWLWEYHEVTGRVWMESYKPWEEKAYDPDKKYDTVPGQKKYKSMTPRAVSKKYTEQQREKKAEEKERKRREAFERDIARRTRKTNDQRK